MRFAKNAEKCLRVILRLSTLNIPSTPGNVAERYYPDDSLVKRRVVQGRHHGVKGADAPRQMGAYLGRLKSNGWVDSYRLERPGSQAYYITPEGRQLLRGVYASENPISDSESKEYLVQIAAREFNQKPLTPHNIREIMPLEVLEWLLLNRWVTISEVIRVTLNAFSEFPDLRKTIMQRVEGSED